MALLLLLLGLLAARQHGFLACCTRWAGLMSGVTGRQAGPTPQGAVPVEAAKVDAMTR